MLVPRGSEGPWTCGINREDQEARSRGWVLEVARDQRVAEFIGRTGRIEILRRLSMEGLGPVLSYLVHLF